MAPAPGTAPLARCLAVWTAATAVAASLAGWVLPLLGAASARLDDGLADQPFDRLLVDACSALVLLGAAWLWLVVTAVSVEALRGAGPRLPGVPGPVRRLLLTACGAAVVGGLTMGLPQAAQATPGDLHTDRGRGPGTSLVAGLPVPDRAVDGAAPAIPGGGRLSAGPLPDDQPDTATVRPGDTLWSLAGRDLGPGAGDARVAERWREIYRLNRAVIGPDPDLIQPAQRLRLPAD